MGKILLVNPNRMRPPVSPIAIDYISSALSLNGFEVDFLDLCFEPSWEEGLSRYLKNNSPLAVGITIRNTDDCYYQSQDFIIPKIREIVRYIKERTERPIILGGVGFSIMPERILEFLDIDLGIWGDGEWAIGELMTSIYKGDDPSHIPGLLVKKNRIIKRNPPDFRDLIHLPLSIRDTVDNQRYFREGAMVGIETKRGCDKGCIYCADPLAKGRKVRCRPPKVVVDEMEILVSRGIDHLHICDSEFNINYNHAEEICHEIIRRSLGEKLRWWTYMIPVPFDEKLAGLMKRAGCAGIDFGVDHGHEGMLRNLGRSFSIDDLKTTANICKKFGIPFMYDLLLGGPGEDYETIYSAIEFMKKIGPSRVGISIGIRIYPGSPLALLVRKEGFNAMKKNIHGIIDLDFFEPVFYISHKVGTDIVDIVSSIVGGDERFFFGSRKEDPSNYNYNENSLLMEAIRKGYKGAFWDILRKINEGYPPDSL